LVKPPVKSTLLFIYYYPVFRQELLEVDEVFHNTQAIEKGKRHLTFANVKHSLLVFPFIFLQQL